MADDVIRLASQAGLALALARRGAAWLACELAPGEGKPRALILPRTGIDDAVADRAFLGATVGRYANRIAHARIACADGPRALARGAESRHHLHGGPEGFHARTWDLEQLSATAARFTLHSPDGDQGYPGDLDVAVTYRLDGLAILMETVATASAPTPLAITNHAYFNLDGDAGDVRGHTLRVAASRYAPVDAELIPTGPPVAVDGTPLDFRQPKRIARDWLLDAQQRLAGGLDHAWLLDEACAQGRVPAACLVSSRGELELRISTTLPALQVYAGQYLGGAAGRPGTPYAACAGVALEPGYLPDSPNHPEWPQASCWLRAGETVQHRIRYDFRALPAGAG